MKKTAKNKIEEVIGIVIIVIIVIFVGRYFLSDVKEYQKIEKQIFQKLKITEITEKVVETISFEDDRDMDEYQRKREAWLESMKRPDFGIKVPFQTKVESKYEVRPLMDKEYYPALKREIKKSKESIYVAMFVIGMGKSASNPVNVLLNELIAAKKRGVNVKVVVENPTWSGSSLYKKNEEAILYLKKGGVDARFDSPDKEVHDKFILIDGDTLFVGNHNWSKSSMTTNRELSVMVKSKPDNPEFLKHFSRIKLARMEETREGKIELIKEMYQKLLSRGMEG